MKNRRRRDFIKPMRRLTLISLLFLIVCIVVGFITGDMVNTGFYLLLLGFVVYIVATVMQYKMMVKCRCRKCGSTEVFATKRGVVNDVKGRCPNCNSKFKEDEIVA